MILEEDQRRKGHLGNTGCFYEGCELSPPQQADPLQPAGYTARVTPALTKMPAPRGRLPTRHPAPRPTAETRKGQLCSGSSLSRLAGSLVPSPDL